MVVQDQALKYARHALFCDECHILVKRITLPELQALNAEGWQGDYYCDDCWDGLREADRCCLPAYDGAVIGFVEERQDITLPIPNQPATIRVLEYKILEVAYENKD